MYLSVFPTVRFFGRFGSTVLLCISTRITSIGWFHALSPPPSPLANIFSMDPNFCPSSLPVALRIPDSASRESPKREPQFVVCRIATALTPRLIPLIPSFRQISMKVSNVPGGLTPWAAILCFVISTVFMQVQKPMVA